MSSSPISPENPEAAIALATSPEEAHDKARAGFPFNGYILEPYTPERRVAAQGMGLIYPFVPESGMAQFDSTGLYPGQLRDIIILLWICSQKIALELTVEEFRAKVWTPSRAISRGEEALVAAISWAAGINLTDTTSPVFREGMQVFQAIVQGVDASDFRIMTEDGGAPKLEEEIDQTKNV